MSTLHHINSETFEEQALKAEGLVIVDFTATWCGPCQRLSVELDAAARELAGIAKIVKVDVDENPDLAVRYGVQGIPNMTFLKDGQVVDTIIGMVPKATIVDRAKKNR